MIPRISAAEPSGRCTAGAEYCGRGAWYAGAPGAAPRFSPHHLQRAEPRAMGSLHIGQGTLSMADAGRGAGAALPGGICGMVSAMPTYVSV